MDTKSVIARFACGLQLLNWGLQNAFPVERRGGDASVLSRFSAVKWRPMGCLSLGISLAISSVKLMKPNRMFLLVAVATIAVCGIQLLRRATKRRNAVEEMVEVAESLDVLESEGGIVQAAKVGSVPQA